MRLKEWEVASRELSSPKFVSRGVEGEGWEVGDQAKSEEKRVTDNNFEERGVGIVTKPMKS